MEQRVSLITLGVADLPRSHRFYVEGLGWRAHSVLDEVVFFQAGGLVIALFRREGLQTDTGLAELSSPPAAIALAHNVSSEAEVRAVLEQAKAAGATIVKAGQATDWGGYSGYFADPDGHLWEVAHNPFWPLAEDGSLRLPESG